MSPLLTLKLARAARLVALEVALCTIVYCLEARRGCLFTWTTLAVAFVKSLTIVVAASTATSFVVCLAIFRLPGLRVLRGLANFYNIWGFKHRYPEDSVGCVLVRGGFRQALGKPRDRLSDLLALLRAELTVPDLVTSCVHVPACNLYTWPGDNYSKDNGRCYRCLLCDCDVCTPAKQWLTHVSGHYGRLVDWHRYSMTKEGRHANVTYIT